MSNRFMISVAALALVAGTGLANAQGTMNRDSGGGAAAQPTQQSQPSGGAAERGGSMGKDSGAMKDEHSGGAMHKNAAEDKAGATKGQRTDERAQGQMDKSQQDKSKSMSQDSSKDTSKDTTKSGQKDKDMKAEGSKSGASSTNNAENRPGSGSSTDMKADGKSSTSSSTTTGQAGAGAKISTEQRTQITSVIREQRVAPVTNVNFSISVGTRIPREGIELHVLPSRVATIYPEWRSYRYVMVREQIVIIDPNTYEIIAVLDV